jgi:hypothetical protein
VAECVVWGLRKVDRLRDSYQFHTNSHHQSTD